jgi:hypothetical protein
MLSHMSCTPIPAIGYHETLRIGWLDAALSFD